MTTITVQVNQKATLVKGPFWPGRVSAPASVKDEATGFRSGNSSCLVEERTVPTADLCLPSFETRSSRKLRWAR